VTVTIHHGDCLAILPDLPTASVQLICTSPPYLGQRRYGDDDREIGWGSLGVYLAELGYVLDQCHRVLDDDGTAWWVIGDKASGSGGAGGDHNKGGSKNWIAKYCKVDTGLANGQWTLAPYRFAIMAQERGWRVRSMITWDKSPTTRPEDPKHANRPLVSTETVVLLAKKVRHRWHPDRLAEPADIWHIRPGSMPGAPRHFAPYPAEIPRRAILAATRRGDTVLDPFNGSGTTTAVADELGRHGIGIELYEP
jgi:site-specific DNA-methyltransferase (adenine-specific)